MCGRYVLDEDGNIVAYVYGVPESRRNTFGRRYNIAPSQKVPIVRQDDEGRRLDLVRWGLIPFWAKDEKVGYKMINARGEDIETKPAFREAFKRRRCLIPASGFFEWQAIPGSRVKQPHFITLQSGELMAFAGIWDAWNNPSSERVESCAIITTEANEMIAVLHNRMPVILDRRDWNAWLDSSASKEILLALLHPYPADEMRSWPVSVRVNRTSEDAPALIERIP